jgi:ureidoacrylate peracid hydrolase
MTTSDGRPAGELTQFELDPARTALLVVDVQNDFCQEGGFFSRSGFDVAPCRAAADRLRDVLAGARELELPVLWTMSTNPDPPNYRLPPLRFRGGASSLEGRRGTDYFVADAWGTQIVADLPPAPDDVVIRKPRYDGFYRTPLEDELRARGVDTIAVGGVTTNCCVDTTVRSAFMRGFEPIVLRDCVAAFGQERDLHDASLRNLSLLFAVVADASELLDRLREAAAVVS